MNNQPANPNASFKRWILFSVAFTVYFAAGMFYQFQHWMKHNPGLDIFFLPATAVYAINPIHLPADASGQGAGIDRLNWLVHWLMAGLFVGWVGYFGYVLFRFRKTTNPKADYIGAKTHASTWVEGAVAIVEGVLLIGFAIPLWAGAVRDFPAEKDSTVIKLVGKQFQWYGWYPGVNGVFTAADQKFFSPDNPFGWDKNDPRSKENILATTDLVVPINKPVIMKVSSMDVIHCFASKPLRVTQDAIPGLSIPAWFQPVKEGTYQINCAQLCGMGHYTMRGTIKVVKQAEYEAWMKTKLGGAGGYE